MSAPSIAATANPNPTSPPSSLAPALRQSARRRALAVTEKKSNTDILRNGKTVEEDLSHTIRGEMVIEPKDLQSNSKSKEVLAKKGVTNPLVSPRRGRKVVTKPETHKWVKFARIFIKNLFLLLCLLGLGNAIMRWVKRPVHVPSMGALDSENRITELESFLKTTTKMMQVQVEVMDLKISNEIGNLRREFGQKVENQEASFSNEIKNLESRTVGLEESLHKFSDMGLSSKEDIVGMLNDLLQQKGFHGNDQGLGLDDIRTMAKEIVEKEIEKHAADGLGRVDYALASGGGKVVRHSEAYYFGKVGNWLPVVKGRNGVHDNAQKMLEPSFGEPGQCFALKGSHGFVEIRLRTSIVPEAVTLEHVARSVAYDRTSALKEFRISGWPNGRDEDSSVDQTERVLLFGEFKYDLERSNAQTFDLNPASSVINIVRLDFLSNHGSPSHTCIYRLRVHGYEPDSLMPLAIQL
ncbi:protein SAD1/UNC-84 domain protein 1 [Amborella trichopoda]|uniref:SUN domain-containing protein n=1 Tax=Amborella trichopoda TaxID=13333 RepID=W1NUS2_AMBTC|nr:protein SAD1/UNC-84 domain protein 1 [Amborella trichopoda]ERM99063.1 hypothetical protein AMTR_s00101p00088850 [Amborella trichopoda]|eukprot:XP_006836210.1 protein SAD1/UNC-84 domain protein 1 [Amborella trichopoda]